MWHALTGFGVQMEWSRAVIAEPRVHCATV
jgi:hypothetical protein